MIVTTQHVSTSFHFPNQENQCWQKFAHVSFWLYFQNYSKVWSTIVWLVYFFVCKHHIKASVYDRSFLFARLNPQCTDKYSKNNFDSDSPSPCFDVPKPSNFTSGGVQNRETKNRRLGTIVTSFQDFKLRGFSYFLINNALLYHFLVNYID